MCVCRSATAARVGAFRGAGSTSGWDRRTLARAASVRHDSLQLTLAVGFGDVSVTPFLARLGQLGLSPLSIPNRRLCVGCGDVASSLGNLRSSGLRYTLQFRVVLDRLIDNRSQRRGEVFGLWV